MGPLLGFSGVVVVSAGTLSGAPLGTPLGVAFGVASAVSWAIGTVYFKRYAGRLPVLWAVGGPFLLGGVCITGLGLALEAPSGITGTFVASLLYTSLMGTALAWVLWLRLIKAGEQGLGLRILGPARPRSAVPGRDGRPDALGRRSLRRLRHLPRQPTQREADSGDQRGRRGSIGGPPPVRPSCPQHSSALHRPMLDFETTSERCVLAGTVNDVTGPESEAPHDTRSAS